MNGFVGRALRALAQTEMTVKKVTSTRRGNLVLAAAFLVGVVIFGANGVGTLEAIVRVREHGLSANATITKVDEQLISFPAATQGIGNAVTVSFTDTSAVWSARTTPTPPVQVGRRPVRRSRLSTTRQSQPRSALWDRTPVGLAPSSWAWGWSAITWGFPSTSRTAPRAGVL